jgi:hypothetical protein
MKKLITLILFVGLSAQASFVDMLNLDFSRKYNISGVPVATSAVYNGTKMKLTGTGTAFKKFGVSKAKIFMMQYFTENPANIVRTNDGVLGSIKDVGNTAIRITFMRNIDSNMIGETLSSSIVENISKDELPRYVNDINGITNAITSDSTFVLGDSISISAYKNLIVYENAKKSIYFIASKNDDITTKLFSMFFGTTTDVESSSLKAQLIQNPKDVFGEEI